MLPPGFFFVVGRSTRQHPWGLAWSRLGFDWAYRQQERAVAYTETFVAPLTLADLPETLRPTLKTVRSAEGEGLVLDQDTAVAARGAAVGRARRR